MTTLLTTGSIRLTTAFWILLHRLSLWSSSFPSQSGVLQGEPDQTLIQLIKSHRHRQSPASSSLCVACCCFCGSRVPSDSSPLSLSTLSFALLSLPHFCLVESFVFIFYLCALLLPFPVASKNPLSRVSFLALSNASACPPQFAASHYLQRTKGTAAAARATNRADRRRKTGKCMLLRPSTPQALFPVATSRLCIYNKYIYHTALSARRRGFD